MTRETNRNRYIVIDGVKRSTRYLSTAQLKAYLGYRPRKKGVCQ